MEQVDKAALRRENTEYLLKIGKLLSDLCPPASRFYISSLGKKVNEFPDLLKSTNKAGVPLYCHHCGSIWNSRNFQLRMQPPQHSSSHIKKLQKIEKSEHWKLNNKQKKKLRKFYESTSKIVYKCLICRNKTTFPGSKTNSSSSHITSTSTPITQLKLNKSDVNAGLFIPSPIVTKDFKKSNLDNSEISMTNSSKTLKSSVTSCDSFSIASDSTNVSSKHESSFPSFKASPESSSKQQLSAKRKKTLLAQILNQEQKKKKKTTLSSFLVSL